MNECRKRTLKSSEATALALSAQAGDKEALNTLAYRSRCLCKVWLARRYKWAKRQDREDMLGVAAVALMRCLETYDGVRPFTTYFFVWVRRSWARWLRHNMKRGRQLDYSMGSIDTIGSELIGTTADGEIVGPSLSIQGFKPTKYNDIQYDPDYVQVSLGRKRVGPDRSSEAVDAIELVGTILGKMEKPQADLIRIVYGIGEGREPRKVRDLERSLGLGRNVLAERLKKARAAFRELATVNS